MPGLALAPVVALAGLHDEALLFGGQVNLVVPAGVIGAIRRVSQTVLVPQVLIDFVVHLGQGLLLGNLVELAACLTRDLVQDFLAVGHIYAAAQPAESAAIRFRVFEEDGVDQGVRPLCGFDGEGEGDLAAVIDSVGEQDEPLAAGPFAHEIAVVARQKDGIVEQGSTTGAPAATHGGTSAAHAPTAPSATAPIGVLLRVLLS